MTDVLEENRPVLTQLGCAIEECEPDFTGADEAFVTWRAFLFELNWGRHFDEDRHQLGEDVRWNIEAAGGSPGRSWRAPNGGAECSITACAYFWRTMNSCSRPFVQVLPFPVEMPYPTVVAGEPMRSYIDWMKSCYFVSAAALPAASVPFGFTSQGLPVGLQVIGRHGHDWSVLQLAHAIERETQCWKRRPPLIEGPGPPSDHRCF